MVGRDIERNRDVTAEILDILELKARDLYDQYVLRPRCAVNSYQLVAYIPARQSTPSGPVEDTGDKSRCRRLPVRPCHRYHDVWNQVVAELYLTYHLDPGATCLHQDRSAVRHTGACYQYVVTLDVAGNGNHQPHGTAGCA